jgi:cytochrome P450
MPSTTTSFTTPNRFDFRPTRWLPATDHKGGVTPQEAQVAQSAYAPFGVGRANCVGRSLAYQEMMSVIAKLMLRYESAYAW